MGMKTMKTVATKIRNVALVKDERGLSTVEYVILACLIAVVAFGAWRKFGGTVKAKTGAADTQMTELPTTTED